MTNPAEYVISLFGGVRATARACGLTPAAVGYWRKRGHIPIKQVQGVIKSLASLGLRHERSKLYPA